MLRLCVSRREAVQQGGYLLVALAMANVGHLVAADAESTRMVADGIQMESH
jgi:hypothetical protein